MRFAMCAAIGFFVSVASIARAQPFDVVIYGGTPAGVAAAVQATRMGKAVVLIEPTKRLGGMASGGLGQTDIGQKDVVGGIAFEFYQAIAKHYADPAAWKWQKRSAYKDGGQTVTAPDEMAMWTFEPSVALSIFNAFVADNHIPVVYAERLNRTSGVKKDGAKIVRIEMESGKAFEGKQFIDATYEGDLMAASGVEYTVGRESASQYSETFNGTQTAAPGSAHHNFARGVDPYVIKGDASSGLLPFIETKDLGEDGTGDKRIQAYCYRMCLTDDPKNRIPFAKPDGYNEQWYEPLFRNYEVDPSEMPWINSSMPNRKTDTNNFGAVSTDFIGQNYDYPDASYDERERIAARHLLYQQGLMWTLANHPRVPPAVREVFSEWGVCKDEFVETNGWPGQLYVREARRMIGQYVMSEANCLGIATANDPVALASYTMDSHHVRRYVTPDGAVRNEGNVEVRVVTPFPISYRSLTPRRDQCTNLLVPVCLSATHIAYGSIRMEPVFMELGQSAATVACLAIDGVGIVQDLPYATLRDRLVGDKQVLARTAASASASKP